MWSYSGAINGMKCLKMEAEGPFGWEDNSLCAGTVIQIYIACLI
jgi:predicted membrane chloride channel (bestrophin family)